MQGVITFETVTFIIAIGGITFGVYHFFRNPDIQADKRICLLEQILKDKDEINGKLLETQQNHLHTIEVAVERNNNNIRKLSEDVISLKTILDERLPRK